MQFVTCEQALFGTNNFLSIIKLNLSRVLFLPINTVRQYLVALTILQFSNRGSNDTGQANQLSMLSGNSTLTFGPVSEYVSFLDSPMLVRGAYMYTNGECSLASSFRVNISSEDDTRKKQ